MSWVGYYEYGGVEVINAARTEAYASVLGAFKSVYHADDLGPILGEVYNSPMQDDAPWTDPDNIDTYDFYGAYPLDVTGVDDSTITAQVVESTLDGAVIGRPRFASKSVVFSVALVGGSEAACEAGFRWLKSVLTGQACGDPRGCGGYELCFLSSKPRLDYTISGDPTQCYDRYARSLHNVAVTVGPSVNSKAALTFGGQVWVCGFTLTAGNPFAFGAVDPVVAGFGNPNVPEPYVGGLPDGATFDAEGFVQNDPRCAKAVYNPLNDPLCPAIISPPSVPNVDIACFNFPVNYRRRQFTLPKERIALWGDVVPWVRIKSPGVESRNVRIRFYADPFDSGDPNSDPCNYCGDIVISYIPAGASLVIDGTDQVVYVEDVINGRRQATHLAFGSDGGPFDWPLLSCGFGYIVTVDTPQAGGAPIVDLSLYQRIS